jgi:putative membrane protein
MRIFNRRVAAIWRPMVLSIALGALGSAACGDDDAVTSDVPEVQSQIDEGERRGTEVNDKIEVELGGEDDAIVMQKTTAIGATLNDGEIMQADLALERSSSEAVRTFADMLVQDHRLNRDQALALLTERNLEPLDTPIAVELRGDAATATENLAAVSDEAFDRAFLDLQLIMHGEARTIVDTFDDRMSDDEVADFWRGTRDTIDRHLEMAVQLSEDSRGE